MPMPSVHQNTLPLVSFLLLCVYVFLCPKREITVMYVVVIVRHVCDCTASLHKGVCVWCVRVCTKVYY